VNEKPIVPTFRRSPVARTRAYFFHRRYPANYHNKYCTKLNLNHWKMPFTFEQSVYLATPPTK